MAALSLFVGLAALGACGGLGGLLRPPGLLSITVDGRERTYRLHVPASVSGASPAALVLVLHGGGGDAAQIARYTGFDRQADAAGFIVCYPNGVTGRWNDGREPPESPVAAVDDVAFIKRLLDELTARYTIDPKRVFVCGISNGAMMSFRLACDLSGRIAAIGPVAGALPANLRDACRPAEAVSVVAFFGTEDRYVPIDGGEVIGRRGMVLSLAETLAGFAARGGCVTQPGSEQLPDLDPQDGTTVRRDRYAPCTQPAAVEAYVITGGGHTWPGTQRRADRLLGRTTRDIDATALIWEFFAAHPRP